MTTMNGRPTLASVPVASAVLPDLIAASVKAHADSIALIFQGQRLTYRDLDRRSNQLARLLISKGVGPESVVPIAFESSVERIVAMLGILAAGGAYLPLDTEAPPSRIEALTSAVTPPLVLTSMALKDRLGLASRDFTLVLDSPTVANSLSSLSLGSDRAG